jgi:hypothetical protein
MSIFSRITTWLSDKDITPSSLNKEFDNVINTLNNLDGGVTVWDHVKVANATASNDAMTFGQFFGPFQKPVYTTGDANFSTTSNSFQTTNCTATITPTSSSHRIKITVTGVGAVLAASANMYVTIARGTTDLSASGFGFAHVKNGAAVTVANSCTMCVVDSPATTSATTYNVRIMNDDNATTVEFGVGSDYSMLLEEIT